MTPPANKPLFGIQWTSLLFLIAGVFAGDWVASQLITGSTTGPIPAPGSDTEKTTTFLIAGWPAMESTGPWNTEPDRFRSFFRLASIPFKIAGIALGRAIWMLFFRRREAKPGLSERR